MRHVIMFLGYLALASIVVSAALLILSYIINRNREP